MDRIRSGCSEGGAVPCPAPEGQQGRGAHVGKADADGPYVFRSERGGPDIKNTVIYTETSQRRLAAVRVR